METTAGLDTRTQILDMALQLFADHGFAGTSLNDIADAVGIKRQTLLYYFGSKEALYKQVVLSTFLDWAGLVENAVEEPRNGWPQVERVLRAAFQFFEEHPEFVRLARREAIEGGPMLSDELGQLLRPLFLRGVAFLDQEMKAGRIRRYDSSQLLLTGYGAVLSYLSDAPLIASLLDENPVSAKALETRREHVLELFRNALAP